ncbi:MAG TPA: hypothetical protein VFK33_10740 [Bacillales bacterium]|nr:hypothetical protein [Bacillales bacterium]
MKRSFIIGVFAFILCILLMGCDSNHKDPQNQDHSESSSASWAYAFVKWNGHTYVMTGKMIKNADKKIGEVTHSSDRETAPEIGNFSNEYPVGTQMYKIHGINVANAIAVETAKGKYEKALSRTLYRQLMRNKNQHRWSFQGNDYQTILLLKHPHFRKIKNGYTATKQVPIGGPEGTKAKVTFTVKISQKANNRLLVTLSKDWHVKRNNKKIKSLWQYKVNTKTHEIQLVKKEDHDNEFRHIK